MKAAELLWSSKHFWDTTLIPCTHTHKRQCVYIFFISDTSYILINFVYTESCFHIYVSGNITITLVNLLYTESSMFSFICFRVHNPYSGKFKFIVYWIKHVFIYNFQGAHPNSRKVRSVDEEFELEFGLK